MIFTKVLCRSVLCLYLSACLSYVCSGSEPIIGEMDVREQIVKILFSKGLHTGFNKSTNLWIGIGTAIKRVETPDKNRKFFKDISNLHKVAFLNAKRDCLKRLGIKFSAKSESRISENNASFRKEFKELSTAIAQGVISQGDVLCVREAWNKNEYAIAVAVGWQGQESGKRYCHVIDESKGGRCLYDRWLKSVNMGSLTGFRRFTDDNGNLYIVGIGITDIQGLSGSELKYALKSSRLNAIQNLSFAMYSDVVIQEVLEKFMVEDGELGIDVWERFMATVIQRCSLQVPPFDEIFNGEITHKLSARKVHITIYASKMTK